MGVDFVVLIDLGLRPDELSTLNDRFDALGPEIAADALAVCRGNTNGDPDRWAWSIERATIAEDVAEDGYTMLRGPWGFGVSLCARCIMVSHWSSWGMFLKEPGSIAAIRRIDRAMARAVRGTTAIYVPDSSYAPAGAITWALDGQSLDGIRAWLAEHCGPPAESLAAIYKDFLTEDGWNTWSGDGYFVDRFDFDGERP